MTCEQTLRSFAEFHAEVSFCLDRFNQTWTVWDKTITIGYEDCPGLDSFGPPSELSPPGQSAHLVVNPGEL